MSQQKQHRYTSVWTELQAELIQKWLNYISIHQHCTF